MNKKHFKVRVRKHKAYNQEKLVKLKFGIN